MAEKRYYWLKLTADFFRQKEIKQLRRIAGGDTFTIIYLKMLLRSLKDGGKLYYEGIDADFASELALDIDEDTESVKITVAYLMSKNILIQGSADQYELITADEMTGSECDSARRVRKLRAAKALAEAEKTLLCNGGVTGSNVTVTTCNTDIEKDLDSDTRVRERVQRKRFTPPTLDEVKAYADEKGYTINAERFSAYYESNGWKVGRNPMKDWRAAVRNWASRDGERQTQAVNTNPALNYQQREYKDEDYGDDFFVDLDKYGEAR